ncbi:succinate dehydrogenase assembly factor 4, mitochondrial [Drosophila hydei]|uniref:Succinate dehydrogenase assembly factor 4, mitochondrial n=1 Tax=Drosophila hydei TaxID=7224 RepID=A0A6J1MAT5_DROHY|nr:succinate dehydrogenase assembly factor 4, mitochondrial [Drosophila hydei]
MCIEMFRCIIGRQRCFFVTSVRSFSASSVLPELITEEREADLKGTKQVTVPSERYLRFKDRLRSEAPLKSFSNEAMPHPAHEKEPLKPWPNNTNPNTGEVGGPPGPEPTRYGDWERKGRVTDF